MKQLIRKITHRKYQEGVIEYLSSQGFSFISYKAMKEMFNIELKRDAHKKYQFMAFVDRHDDPRKDIYDPSLIIGIKLYGRRIPILLFYIKGKFKGYLSKPWQKSLKVNYNKKKKLRKFPKSMDIEQRKQWRYIEEKRIMKGLDCTDEQLEFYFRFKDEVDKINE